MDTDQFADHKYVNLETYRRNGEGVATPVWFAVDATESGAIYVRTFEKTGKVRRLRRGSRIRVVPCDARGQAEGTWMDGEVRIVAATSEEAQRANRLLNAKYGLMKRVTEFAFGLKYGKVVTISLHVEGSRAPSRDHVTARAATDPVADSR